MLLGVASTTLRAVIGDISLDEVLSKRETSKPDRGLVVFRDLVYNQRDELVFQMDKTVLMRTRASLPPAA